MPWTLQIGATTQSLEAWGISGTIFTLKSFEASTLTFNIAGEFDATPLAAYGDALILRSPDGVIRFVGKVRQLTGGVAGHEESRSYVLEDVLGDMARRVMLQDWEMWDGEALGPIVSPLAVLFDDGTGGDRSIGTQLSVIVAAAAAAGVAVQMGDALSMVANPRRTDLRARTYLEALKVAAKFVPDCATRVDNNTTPPTLHFIRRVDAHEVNLAVIGNADEFKIDPLYDQQVNSVLLFYERIDKVGEDTLNAGYSDIAPEGATGREENALVVYTHLSGSVAGGAPASAATAIVQTQSIQTAAINASSFTWWQTRWPALASRNEIGRAHV